MNRKHLKYVIWALTIACGACFLLDFLAKATGGDRPDDQYRFYGLCLGAATLLFAILLFITVPAKK